MARIRTIKPEFWSDEKLAPQDPVTRLVFLGLVSQADDAGRLVDNVKLIDGLLFPETEDSSRDALETLARIGRIIRYTSASGQRLIQITNWEKHQKVDKPSKQLLPPPPEDLTLSSRDSRDTLATPSRDPRAPTMDHGPSTMDLGPTTMDHRPPIREGEVDGEGENSLTLEETESVAAINQLEGEWSTLKGRNPPFKPEEYSAMREALELPGSSLALVVEVMRRVHADRKAKGDEPSSFKYFLPELKRELNRRQVTSQPLHLTAGTAAPLHNHSQAYERARQGYYERRFARENPKTTAPGIQVQKLLLSGCWDGEFQLVIREDAATVERMVANSRRPDAERKALISTQYPLAALASELTQTEGVA